MTIDTEQIIRQIPALESQRQRAEWQMGAIFNDVKAQLDHGAFTDFAGEVFRILGISLSTMQKYMRVNREFPEPIALEHNITTLYAMMRTNLPEPVKRFCVENKVQSPAMVDYAAGAFERKGISSTWQELQVSKSIALDGESVHVSEVTARDLKYMEHERRLIHAQSQGQEYRFTAYVESVEDNRAVMVISGGIDDLVKLAGREGVVIRAYVKGE